MSQKQRPRGQRVRRRPGVTLLATVFVSSLSPLRARAQATEAPVGTPDDPARSSNAPQGAGGASPSPDVAPDAAPKANTPATPDAAKPAEAKPPPAPANPAPAGGSNTNDSDLQRQIDAAIAHDATTAVVQNPNPSTVPGTAGAPGPMGRAQSMNPEIAFILDFAGAYFSGVPFETGEHDPHETGFTLQQLELSGGANVDPYFRLDAHISFQKDSIDLEEAYGTTLGLPYGLQARFGQFLHRFGRINPTHPHTWDFVDQPWAIGRIFGAEGGRNPGAELSWLTPLPWYVELVGTAQLATGETTARSFYGPNNPGVHSLGDLLYVPAIKQFFALSDDWSLSWGLSGAFGPNASGPGNRTDVYGTDLYLKFRPITVGSYTIVALQTEWFYRRREVPGDLQTDVSSYTQLFYRFAERWAAAARWDYASPTHAASGAPVTEALEADWLRRRNRIGLNVTFWPTEFSRLRLQGARDISSSSLSGWSAFLAVELVAGAHGAHTF